MAQENIEKAEKLTKENMAYSIKLAKRNGIKDIEMTTDQAIAEHNKLVKKYKKSKK